VRPVLENLGQPVSRHIFGAAGFARSGRCTISPDGGLHDGLIAVGAGRGLDTQEEAGTGYKRRDRHGVAARQRARC